MGTREAPAAGSSEKPSLRVEMSATQRDLATAGCIPVTSASCMTQLAKRTTADTSTVPLHALEVINEGTQPQKCPHLFFPFRDTLHALGRKIFESLLASSLHCFIERSFLKSAVQFPQPSLKVLDQPERNIHETVSLSLYPRERMAISRVAQHPKKRIRH